MSITFAPVLCFPSDLFLVATKIDITCCNVWIYCI